MIIVKIILLIINLLKQFQHVIVIKERGNSGKAHRIYRYLIHYYVDKCVVYRG